MNIGRDIVDEILSRLPVKSLIRFKVLCKDWYFDIQSDYFKAKHMKNQTTKPKTLIYHKEGDRFNNYVASICNEEEKEEGDQQYYIKDLQLDWNLNKDHYCAGVQLIGTCNGLLCLDYIVWNRSEFPYDRNIILWNPATRDFKSLSLQELQTPQGDFALGLLRSTDHIVFGFDSTSNDYKVIRFGFDNKTQFINQGAIYSLNTNSWRKLDYSDVSAQIAGRFGSTIVFCDKVHWVVLGIDRLKNRVLLSFDMGKEVFQMTPLPAKYEILARKYCYKNTEFFTLHVSIALVFHGRMDDTFDCTLAIWTTKELEQGRASWIKVLNIDHVRISRPLGFRKCKNSADYLFMFIQYTYVITDWSLTMKGIYMNNQGQIKNDTVMTIKVEDNIVLPRKLVTYVETLVSVNSP